MIKIYEAKQDIERLEQFVGDEYANKFLSVRSGLKSPQNDIYYWLKKDKQELIDFLDSYQSNSSKIKNSKIDGAELVYSDSDWKVYHITTYEASKYYGKNTKWCISGSEVWENGENGEKYFNDYTKQGIKFYFYINSSNEKYALALYPNEDYDLFNAEDKVIKYILNVPDVKGLPDIKYEEVKIKDNIVTECINKEIESYEIPYGVEEIREHAFEWCMLLKSINIPNSVTYIGNCAFQYCESLKSITIPDTVAEIENGTFYGCTSLKSINIPDTVTRIGRVAFQDCESLESISIPNSVTVIDMRTFIYCESLKSITIPNSVKGIGISAFESCISLKSINIPNSVTEICEYAFHNCKSLESITIPNSVTKIGSYTFGDCTSLESINIPDSVTKISYSAFEHCPNLTVYCNKGSYAEKYCIDDGIKYISK